MGCSVTKRVKRATVAAGTPKAINARKSVGQKRPRKGGEGGELLIANPFYQYTYSTSDDLQSHCRSCLNMSDYGIFDFQISISKSTVVYKRKANMSKEQGRWRMMIESDNLIPG